jgi:hypothetical protein
VVERSREPQIERVGGGAVHIRERVPVGVEQYLNRDPQPIGDDLGVDSGPEIVRRIGVPEIMGTQPGHRCPDMGRPAKVHRIGYPSLRGAVVRIST